MRQLEGLWFRSAKLVFAGNSLRFSLGITSFALTRRVTAERPMKPTSVDDRPIGGLDLNHVNAGLEAHAVPRLARLLLDSRAIDSHSKSTFRTESDIYQFVLLRRAA